MTDQEEISTRERILAAAAAILGEEGMAARLSVRRVAARAGVSAGSLRHHFPTQQALRDELMGRIYDWMVPAERIRDTSVPARERLVECLREVLGSANVGQQARDAMTALTREFIAVEQTARVREAYLTMERDGQRRVEGWLRVLANEDAVAADDIPRRARFLNTVLEGLALKRALPSEDTIAQAETETLYAAVDAVLLPEPLTPPARRRRRSSDRAGWRAAPQPSGADETPRRGR